MSDNLRERKSNNEGWIYCGKNDKNTDLEGYIKVGKTSNNVSSRENNTNGAGYNIFFAVKVDDCEFYEQLIHKMFEEFNYQNYSSSKRKKDNWQEWFCIKFENLLPFLLKIATDFEIRDKDFCTKICDTIDKDKDFYRALIKRQPNKYQKLNEETKRNKGYCELLNEIDFKQDKDNKNKVSATIQQNTNNLCKYETISKTGGIIFVDWKLFFDDHKELVGKDVYCNFDKDKKYLAKIAKIKNGSDYGVIFNNEEMSFSGYTLYLYKKIKDPNFKYTLQGAKYVFFVDSGKSLLQTYNELTKKN